MILLTPELQAALRVNADRSAGSDHDPAPVVKFFNPLGAATWLATELYDDGDTLFGLCRASHKPNYVKCGVMLSWLQNAAGWPPSSKKICMNF